MCRIRVACTFRRTTIPHNRPRIVSSHDLQTRLQQVLGGAYTIERELSGGGMSRVFVADEASLERKVVVKVLQPELTEGISAERFKREIRLAARLQHPHIVPLLAAGVLEGGLLFYTMPYIDGESLRERIAREGCLPVAESVSILRDVAGALAYAHRAGIVHRDIKPDNVLLSDGGAVVADFGIAKAITAARSPDGERPPRTTTLTTAGTSLGTPAYMAPEQAAGEQVDQRADLYALGVVAYEMLSGHPPFEGRNAQQLLAAHATQTPEPLAQRRPAVPAALGTLVMRLLEKNPADRPRSADEVGRALDELATTDGRASLHVVSPAPFAPEHGRVAVVHGRFIGTTWRVLPWALLAAALLFVAMRARTVERIEHPIAANIAPPSGQELQPAYHASFSPDGARLAFVAMDGQGRSSLWVRALDSARAVRIDHTDGAQWTFWSPDGTTIGFFAGGKLKTVELRSNVVRALCPVSYPTGGVWMRSGTIVYAPELLGALYSVRAKGGPCRPATTLRPGDLDHRRPSELPDGRVLFSGVRSNKIMAVDLSNGHIVDVRKPGRDAQFAAPDRVLFFDEDNGPLYAQRLDLKTLAPIGEPRILVDHVMSINGHFARFAVTEHALVYDPAPMLGAVRLISVDRRSVVRDSIVAPADAQTFAPSHDGRRIAFGGYGISLYDRARNVTTRLGIPVAPGQITVDVAWAPGDSLMAYRTAYVGAPTLMMYHVRSGVTDSLFAADRRVVIRPTWSPDGRRIAFTLRSGTVGAFEELWIYSLDDRAARRAWPARGNHGSPAWSPNGRWLAYESDESGAFEVYVRSLAGDDVPVRVSSAGGQFPRWRGDGRSLFYRAPDGSIMEVSVTGDRALELSPPRVAVVGAPFSFAASNRSFAVSADGEQFTAFARGDTPTFTLLLDWQAALSH